MEDMYNYIDADYMLKMERKCDKIDEDWFRIATTYKTLYRLDSETALYLLARISTTAIHYTQKGCISPEERDAVEDRFHEVLDYALGTLDMMDVMNEERRKMS